MSGDPEHRPEHFGSTRQSSGTTQSPCMDDYIIIETVSPATHDNTQYAYGAIRPTVEPLPLRPFSP